KGTAHRSGVSRCARQGSAPVTNGRTGCRVCAAESRCDRGADREPGVADGSRERRPLPGRKLDAVRGVRIRECPGAGRILVRAAGGNVIHREGEQRGYAAEARVWLRTGCEPAKGAAVPGYGADVVCSDL